MPEPTTTIDPRYSVPDPVATDWEMTRHTLETAQVFWLSTLRADGRPHVTPVVAVWLDGAMCSARLYERPHGPLHAPP
jgi:hypothetical protein